MTASMESKDHHGGRRSQWTNSDRRSKDAESIYSGRPVSTTANTLTDPHHGVRFPSRDHRRYHRPFSGRPCSQEPPNMFARGQVVGPSEPTQPLQGRLLPRKKQVRTLVSDDPPGVGWDCFVHAHTEALRPLGEVNGSNFAAKAPRPFHLVQVAPKLGLFPR